MEQHPEYADRFSIGFAIDLEAREVALIKKLRGPKFNLGRFNAVGGHQRLSESQVGCIRREAKEEMDIDLPDSGQWQLFHAERRDSNQVQLWCYCADVPGLRNKAKTMTDEEVQVVGIEDVFAQSNFELLYGERLFSGFPQFVYNMPYLLPMAMCWLKYAEHRYVEL